MKKRADPDLGLARAVEDAIIRAGMAAFSAAATDPSRAEGLMRHADRLESNYTSERGEHYSATISRSLRDQRDEEE